MSLLELYGIKLAPVLTDTAVATVTSESGTRSTSLPVRQDPDCPHRKQVQTPCKHHEWNVLYWNEYAGVYEPIHCHDCVITINVCPQQPAARAVVATPEPVAPEALGDVEQVTCKAEPGPVEEPAALKPVRPEQKQYFVKFVLNSDQSKKYAMLFRRDNGLAVGCECKSRKFHRGVACKHMRAHNAMLTPATAKKQQEAA